MRWRAGSVPEISVFPTGISVSGVENLLYEHFSPVTGMKVGWTLRMNSASSCFACCIFHIKSISFENSYTAIRVAKAIIGTKVITLCFAMFALFLEFRATARLRPSHLGNRAVISHINPRGNWSGQPGSWEKALKPIKTSEFFQDFSQPLPPPFLSTVHQFCLKLTPLFVFILMLHPNHFKKEKFSPTFLRIEFTRSM